MRAVCAATSSSLLHFWLHTVLDRAWQGRDQHPLSSPGTKGTQDLACLRWGCGQSLDGDGTRLAASVPQGRSAAVVPDAA